MTVRIERVEPDAAGRSTEAVRSVYEASYVDAIASGDPFDAPSAFMDRFSYYVKIAGFDMAFAYQQNVPVGQIWGWPLAAGTKWWDGLLHLPSEDFTEETGSRTFALSEIMVAAEWAGHGIARKMHDFLLAKRTEQRATLLVEPDNKRARQAYLSWGWEPVSQLRPAWANAPLFDVMIRQLPNAWPCV